ncbi:MAG: tRNA preQ1(34) S-adenosylmethionine ribosyltransferase-isomerase QueA [Gammaproteobacteria bacterium]|nr:tRNA preQ1(34) S-adenosylmethionine ribosyltransferase-isomerase QueA [Gammaproteobacteria bacterium]NNF48250.1 tRNA preQ1(34) S-adenosylmethionine ribosyltransferase-isomerase QueA [Woeseiaceae bacterium]MBT8094936.1 tRNA preQ1(34) S-adenosylmethionine ribosyltransferase-isomerase QueA [Gammaproteobacteria bacterium]MBT8105463.1 tRNA preQ1(34) S-adenosylmethionine ribosyltransferase-isomerase QueA [Gammaproteobacteria bacterium]NNK25477.1 tRNA preQ1(34) S-adenosylmethionine ribosyltransfera
MLISDFDYELPPSLIARYPAKERRGSRLLALDNGIRDLGFAELPSLLHEGDLLVFNDTRVIKARLRAHKETGGKAEILIERIEGPRTALAHVRASKSPQPGGRLLLADGVAANVTGRDRDFFALEFSTDVLPFLDAHGEVPLPPYLEREADEADIERYQTVYARDPGAVAAPTAGMHFDSAMLEETRAMGVRHAHVTLHVGAGTFQNLRDEHIEANRLHAERVDVNASCVDAVRETKAAGGRVIAVGTTTVRSLECASVSGTLLPFDGETDLFILPGFAFRTVDAVITNFHLPRSSLLMLVAAFAGTERILAAYRHAVREKYRFFSYGDVMFLTPEAAT